MVDFILKPFRSNQLLNAIARCLDRKRLQRENDVLRHELTSPSHQLLLRDRLLGTSKPLQHVREAIARMAPLPTFVLLTGQSGTRKEVAACSLHMLSGRADKPFVPVTCGAIPAEMIESELFGHLKGAFTGASRSDAVILFYRLQKSDMGKIVDIQFARLARMLEERKIGIVLEDAGRDWLAEKGLGSGLWRAPFETGDPALCTGPAGGDDPGRRGA